jgi:hypothetical protein
MSRYGVTIQPIALHFGAVTSFSPVAPIAGGGGGGGGGGGAGAGLLLPLIAALFVPLLAAGPGTPPTAAPLAPPVSVASTSVPLAGGKGAVAGPGTAPSSPSLPVVLTPPSTSGSVPTRHPSGPPAIVVLSRGPIRVRAVRPPQATGPVTRVGRRPGPSLPFTGENLWLPVVVGLELIVVGAWLRRGVRTSADRGKRLGL